MLLLKISDIEVEMNLWLLFALCFVIQCFSTPLFLKLSWPTRSMRSLAAKMVSATLFVAVGFLSANISANESDFAKTMLVGLCLGWVGDFFLHSDKNSCFGIGMVSFMAGHVAYIFAYIRALNSFEGYNHFNIIEVLSLAVLLVSCLFVFKRFKFEFSLKILKFGVVVYTGVLVVMFLKATSLGLNYMLSGGENGLWALLTLALGSLFFLLSDATIGVLMFGGQKKNRPLKIFNIVTYFAGQMLLASSILFIKI